jgi:tetratricopeptide (TPR) repeat protein
MIRLLTIALLLFGCAATSAQTRDTVVGMSEKVFKAVGEAQALIEAEDYDGARVIVAETLTRRRLSTYEQAHLLNIRGYTWYEQEDLARAIASYDEALALPDLPASMLITLRLTLGQVQLVSENYPAAEGHLRVLLTLEGQDTGNNKALLAASLIGQERHAEALDPLIDAIASEEAREGGIVRESWLSMLTSVYYELGDYASMRDVVEKLVLLYPRQQYVMNLAALHGELGDSEKQLALIESLNDDDRLHRNAQLVMLVNLLLGAELPYQAAQLLDRGIESGEIESTVRNLELLSQAWYLSAETGRAIAPLETAAEMSESGEIYLRLARLHMDAYQWAEAEQAAEAALDKGGLKEEGQAWLLRGMADVRLKRFTEASRQFKRAADFEETEEYARQWIRYVQAENARIAAAGS